MEWWERRGIAPPAPPESTLQKVLTDLLGETSLQQADEPDFQDLAAQDSTPFPPPPSGPHHGGLHQDLPAQRATPSSYDPSHSHEMPGNTHPTPTPEASSIPAEGQEAQGDPHVMAGGAGPAAQVAPGWRQQLQHQLQQRLPPQLQQLPQGRKRRHEQQGSPDRDHGVATGTADQHLQQPQAASRQLPMSQLDQSQEQQQQQSDNASPNPADAAAAWYQEQQFSQMGSSQHPPMAYGSGEGGVALPQQQQEAASEGLHLPSDAAIGIQQQQQQRAAARIADRATQNGKQHATGGHAAISKETWLPSTAPLNSLISRCCSVTVVG